MSIRTGRLQSENAKLREEIKKLQGALKEINNDLPISKTESYVSNKEIRYDLRKEVEDSLNSFKNSQSTAQKKEAGTNPVSFDLLPENLQSSSKHSFMQSPSDEKSNLISLFKTTSEDRIVHTFESPDFPKKIKSSLNQERNLKDSFDSYYESEQENLDKSGRCELSFQDYDNDHEKGSRRKERNLLTEIETLRNENSSLRNKLKTSFTKLDKENKAITTDRSTSKYKTSRSNLESDRAQCKVKKTPRKQRSKSPSVMSTSISKSEIIESKDKSPRHKSKLKTPRNKISSDKSPQERSRTNDKSWKSSRDKSPNRQKTCNKLTSRSSNGSKTFTPRTFSQEATPRRSGKDDKSILLTSKTENRSATPSRSRHCKKCDNLLSSGYSTVDCKKHGA